MAPIEPYTRFGLGATVQQIHSTESLAENHFSLRCHSLLPVSSNILVQNLGSLFHSQLWFSDPLEFRFTVPLEFRLTVSQGLRRAVPQEFRLTIISKLRFTVPQAFRLTVPQALRLTVL